MGWCFQVDGPGLMLIHVIGEVFRRPLLRPAGLYQHVEVHDRCQLVQSDLGWVWAGAGWRDAAVVRPP